MESRPEIKVFEERRRSETPHLYESSFGKDRSRVIHSFGFRRLQGKTQVLGVSEGDFHRTRLTHSLEVAQTSVSITNHLKAQNKELIGLLPSSECIETIGLAHDLGHPPFGHNGEAVLNRCMIDHGGFEGNGQTLRLISKLNSVVKKCGLNLTRRVLLGVLKYPTAYSKVNNPEVIAKPPKCYLDSESEVIDWVLDPFEKEDRSLLQSHSQPGNGKHGKAKHHSLDTSIMELGDDISYATHDLEDAILLGFIRRDHFEELYAEVEMPEEELKPILDSFFAKYAAERKTGLNQLIHLLVSSIELKEKNEFSHPLLKWQASMPKDKESLLNALKALTFRKLMRTQNVRTIEYKGKVIIEKVFEALLDAPDALLPEIQASIYSQTQDPRVISDYIAGMTDDYAARFYERLFVPSKGSVFERI